MGLGNPGDEVMLLSPSWATYDAQIKLLGMTPFMSPLEGIIIIQILKQWRLLFQKKLL